MPRFYSVRFLRLIAHVNKQQIARLKDSSALVIVGRHRPLSDITDTLQHRLDRRQQRDRPFIAAGELTLT
jgi:hypothetical protein